LLPLLRDRMLDRYFEDKIVTREQLADAVRLLPRPLVATNGVFDILHRGHVTYLAQARALGASLIVAVNSDLSAKGLGKGSDRPINPEGDRVALLAALQCVDLVTLFDDPVPLQVLKLTRPEIYVKGGDYDIDNLPESQAVRSWGGRAVSIPFVHERSTTDLLARIRASGC
jgi:rfaE bifunctional protein nucleotidyltransferase chain/domain